MIESIQEVFIMKCAFPLLLSICFNQWTRTCSKWDLNIAQWHVDYIWYWLQQFMTAVYIPKTKANRKNVVSSCNNEFSSRCIVFLKLLYEGVLSLIAFLKRYWHEIIGTSSLAGFPFSGINQISRNIDLLWNIKQ